VYIICDAEKVIQDMASSEGSLSRGLPYLETGGKKYPPDELAKIAWQGRRWIGDHFDGETHTPDSPARAEAEAYEAETRALKAVLNALLDTEAALEADVSELTLANVQDWPQAIEHVAAASSPAEFAQRWQVYESKRTLFTLRLIRFVLTRLAGPD